MAVKGRTARRRLTWVSAFLSTLLVSFDTGLAQQNRRRHQGPPWAIAAVTGKVTDPSGEAIVGATVEIRGPYQTTTTDENGKFQFEVVRSGAYVVTATSPGFFPSRPVRVDLETTVDVEIVLSPKEVVSETVVVTGTLTEHIQTQAPVRTAVISSRDIRERKAATNLAETLSATISGVRVENNCQNCGALGVRLNGLESKYTQILEDGMPTLSGVSMVYALDQIPAEFLESIEVVKGGGSALYGPNAVGGVINLIRREPQDQTLLVNSQLGWHHGRPAQSAGAVGQLSDLPGELSADFYFRGLRSTPVDRDGDGFSEAPKRESLSGGATLFRRFREGRGRLAAGGHVLDDYRRGGGQMDLPPEQTWITEMAETLRSGAFFRWNHAPLATTYYSVAAGFHHVSRDSYFGTGFDPNAYGYTVNPLITANGQIAHQAGNHSLLGGSQFQTEAIRDDIPAYRRHFDDRFSDIGLYVQDEYRASNRITLVGGVRLDKANTLDHWVASPRGNLRIGLGAKWNLRLGASTGFRAPVIFEEDLHVAAVGGEGFVIQNAARLRAEQAVSFTASLDYLGTIRDLPIQIGVNLFGTSLDNVHVLREIDNPFGDYRTFLRTNAEGSYLRGAEFDASWRPWQSLLLRGGATFQLARYREPEPVFGSMRYLRTPPRYGFFAADAALPKSFTAYLDAEFTGQMLAPHYRGYIPTDRLERTPAFAVWNLKVGRTMKLAHERRVEIYAAADNLFDSYQADLDQGPYRDSSYVYGPRIMRTIRIGMTWVF